MAYTFPLPLADFSDLLRVGEATFQAPPLSEMSMTGAGEALTHTRGPSLWRGAINIAADYRENTRGIRALIDLLSLPGSSFLISDPSYVGPKSDRSGMALGAFAPKLNAVAGGTGDVTISELPPNYWLRAGDYFSFQYAASPTRYALHQIVKDKQGPAGGTLGGLIVHPPIRTGWAANAAITLIKPVCKAIIVPGSVSEAAVGRVAATGLSFRWQQTLR